MNFCFVCPYRLWSGRGWQIISMLGIVFSWWVFIHLSLHESVAGNRDAQSQNEKYHDNKFLRKCWYGRHPWIRLAMDCERMMESKWTLFFICEPPIMCLAWKILGTFGRSVVRKSMPLQIILSLNLSIELWHLCKSLLPSAKGLSIYFYEFFIFWVSSFS